MGKVWLALDRRLGRQVAVKVLKSALDADPGARSRFQEEAMMGARLKHPNIVVVHDVGHDGSYIVQEYVEGKDLRRILEGYPSGLPTQALLSLGVQVADAMQAAHCEGVVHRDIKPGNIMVDNHNHAKLGDFGLSVIIDPTRVRPHVWVGTPYYLAPEQARKDADAHADCYAFGCLLYEMATGRPPFNGDTAEEIIEKHKFDLPEPPITYRGNLLSPINDLILELLAKNPTRRPIAQEGRIRLVAIMTSI